MGREINQRELRNDSGAIMARLKQANHLQSHETVNQ